MSVIGDRAKTYADLAGADRTTTPHPRNPTPGKTSSASLSPPSPQWQPRLGIKGGVIVTSVRPGSFADEIGLGKGAVITEINRKPVTDETQLPRHRLNASNPRMTSSSSFSLLTKRTSTPT